MPSRRRLVRLAFSLLLAAVIAVVGVDVAQNPAPSGQVSAARETATLERVVDGDTIWVSGHRKVRLIGINAPELNPPERYGTEATRHLEELLGGGPLTLEKDVSETDKYGRLLRYVYVNGANVSVRMVRDGYATSSSFPPDVKYQEEIRAAEREARAFGRGLWQ